MKIWVGRLFYGEWMIRVLLLVSLVASAVHFADNAFRLDLYPGPVWLTRDVVLASWLVVVGTAGLAYWSGRWWALMAYGVLGFAGLAHFLVPHAMRMSSRCDVTIGAEAVASGLLMVCVLFRRWVLREPWSNCQG